MFPISLGVTIFGAVKMFDSNYVLTDLNHGFVFSIIWTFIGISSLWQWFLWFLSHLLTFTKMYKMEHLLFNGGFILISACFIISGIVSIHSNPLHLNPCACESGYFGIDCLPCTGLGSKDGICSGHGVCDDTVMGNGFCACDNGYTGSDCSQCASHFVKNNNNECVCEMVWEGEMCQKPKIGYNTTKYPVVTCSKGWDQTAAVQSPFETTWPICGSCSEFYAGNAEVECKPCLGTSTEVNENTICNGHGMCWDNKMYKEQIWDKGLKDKCTQTNTLCSKDSDCAETSNCGGRCRSRFEWPDGPSASWSSTFEGNACHEDSDCNFQGNEYIGQVLPEGWDSEGQCVEKTCCKEHRYGNATCFNCRGNDIIKDGKTIKGPLVIGRIPPACDACPGWDNDIDINGQTICNAKGTCLATYNSFGEYDSTICKCQSEDNSVWRGDFCECLADSIYSNTCKRCVQGFYLPANADESIKSGVAVSASSKCFPCPGAEKGTGVSACSWKRGLGMCIQVDAVGKKKDENFQERLLNVGKCSCTTQLLNVPPIVAKGEKCDEAPANFYKMDLESDWTIMSCPRTLPLDPSVCENIGAKQYIWEYLGTDGLLRKACTESCGGKPIEVSMCIDSLANNKTYLSETFKGKWTISENQTGQCFCNGNNILGNNNEFPEAHYYKGSNGLCTKSKVKIN